MQIDPSNPDTFGYATSEIYTELRHLVEFVADQLMECRS